MLLGILKDFLYVIEPDYMEWSFESNSEIPRLKWVILIVCICLVMFLIILVSYYFFFFRYSVSQFCVFLFGLLFFQFFAKINAVVVSIVLKKRAKFFGKFNIQYYQLCNNGDSSTCESTMRLMLVCQCCITNIICRRINNISQ